MDYQLELMAALQTIYIANATGKGGDGQPTFGAPVSRTAIVSQPTKTRTVSVNGEEKIIAWEVVCAYEIKPTDRVWLPGADSTVATQGRKPLVTKQATEYLGTTPTHYYAAF